MMSDVAFVGPRYLAGSNWSSYKKRTGLLSSGAFWVKGIG